MQICKLVVAAHPRSFPAGLTSAPHNRYVCSARRKRMVSRYPLISHYVWLIPTTFSAPSLSWVPFFDPEDIKILGIGAIRNFSKGTGPSRVYIRLWGTKDPFIRPRCIGTVGARAQYKSINSSLSFKSWSPALQDPLWRCLSAAHLTLD